MKSKFLSAPDRLMKRAQEELSAVAGEPTNTAPPKTQTRGAAGKLAESLPQSLPIKGQKLLSPKRVRIREGLERAEAEYNDAAFRELVQSIRASEGNIDPIDVRILEGVAGFDAELLAGTRRLMACREAGVHVLANIRECDDRMADRIHETENKHRKNKSPYSRGLQYKAMMDSKRYASITELADTILTRKQEISETVSLIEKAPKGMWEKVSDAGAIKTTQVRPLMAAYGNAAFEEAVTSAGPLTVAELVELARAALRPAPSSGPASSRTRLSRRREGYAVVLPTGTDKKLAKGAVEVVRKYLEDRQK